MRPVYPDGPEVEAGRCQDDADAKRATCLFIHGMLEIGAKAYVARAAAEGVTTT